MTFLQSQIKDKDASILAMHVELSGAKAKVAAIEASHGGLVKIAAQSVSHMKVALGLSAVDLSAMSAEAVLTEHATVSEAFKAAFKAGGVAAPSDTEKLANASKPDPDRAARLAATRFQPRTK